MRLTMALVATWAMAVLILIGAVVLGAITAEEARSLSLLVTPLTGVAAFAVGMTLARRS